MGNVTYLEDAVPGFKIYKSPARVGPAPLRLRPGQGADGYGHKISTDYMVEVDGIKRKYRVYAICFSNVASHYVMYQGIQYFLHDWDFDEKLVAEA